MLKMLWIEIGPASRQFWSIKYLMDAWIDRWMKFCQKAKPFWSRESGWMYFEFNFTYLRQNENQNNLLQYK